MLRLVYELVLRHCWLSDIFAASRVCRHWRMLMRDNVDILLDYNAKPRSKRARRKAAKRISHCVDIAVARRYVFAVDPILYDRLTYAINRRMPPNLVFPLMLVMSPNAIAQLNRINTRHIYSISDGALYVDTIKGSTKIAVSYHSSIVDLSSDQLMPPELYVCFERTCVHGRYSKKLFTLSLADRTQSMIASIALFGVLVVSLYMFIVEERTFTLTHIIVDTLRVLVFTYVAKKWLHAIPRYSVIYATV